MQIPAQESEDSGEPAESVVAVLGDMLVELAALKEYAAYLLSVVVDQTKLRARQVIFGGAVACFAVCVLFTVAMSFAVLLVLGIDGAIAAAVGSSWGGHLATGLGGLAILAGLIFLVKARQERAHRDETVVKYEQRKRDEQERTGEDVDDASRAAA